MEREGGKGGREKGEEGGRQEKREREGGRERGGGRKKEREGGREGKKERIITQ